MRVQSGRILRGCTRTKIGRRTRRHRRRYRHRVDTRNGVTRRIVASLGRRRTGEQRVRTSGTPCARRLGDHQSDDGRCAGETPIERLRCHHLGYEPKRIPRGTRHPRSEAEGRRFDATHRLLSIRVGERLRERPRNRRVRLYESPTRTVSTASNRTRERLRPVASRPVSRHRWVRNLLLPRTERLPTLIRQSVIIAITPIATG